jgi:hypothetical protein
MVEKTELEPFVAADPLIAPVPPVPPPPTVTVYATPALKKNEPSVDAPPPEDSPVTDDL